MNTRLNSKLNEAVSEAVRHAAETTKAAAVTTAHTINTLADDAQHRLEDLPLPGRAARRRRERLRPALLVAALVVVAVVVVLRRHDAERNDDTDAREATDSAPSTTAPAQPLSSVR